MSYQPQFPGFFSSAQGAAPAPASDVAAPQPATEKQVHYATMLAVRTGASLPEGIIGDRTALSRWIDAQRPNAPLGAFGNYPSSRQVAFAERIARLKRRDIPRECFRDKTLMSRWIEGNKLR